MSHRRAYEVWKAQRARIDVDERFADRVMERIRQTHDSKKTARGSGTTVRVRWHRLAAAVLLLVGVGIGLFRLGSVIAFVLFTCTEGY